MRGRCRAVVLALLPVAACVGKSHHPRPAAAPVFSPQAFFSGWTTGEGVLRIVLSRARRVRVEGEGHLEEDGTLVLVQRVEEDGKPSRTRTWRLRPTGGGRLSGTLTDARGPVDADVHGNLLHVRFAAKGGLRIEQWIALQPDGRTALNRLVVRKAGIAMAVLTETITRS